MTQLLTLTTTHKFSFLGHYHPARLVAGLKGPPLRFGHVGETKYKWENIFFILLFTGFHNFRSLLSIDRVQMDNVFGSIHNEVIL